MTSPPSWALMHCYRRMRGRMRQLATYVTLYHRPEDIVNSRFAKPTPPEAWADWSDDLVALQQHSNSVRCHTVRLVRHIVRHIVRLIIHCQTDWTILKLPQWHCNSVRCHTVRPVRHTVRLIVHRRLVRQSSNDPVAPRCHTEHES